jgi:hypothetical protein
MQHVRRGTIAKTSRRVTAMERLEKHIGDHKNNHVKINKEFSESHDKSQKEEFKHLKELIK